MINPILYFKIKIVYCREDLGEKFFKIEVPSGFLQEFFKVAIEICSPDAVAHVIELLKIFSKCNRFSLSLAMMSEKACMKLLFESLCSVVQKGREIDSIKELGSIYCVSLQGQ
jgi:hypothetical protein